MLRRLASDRWGDHPFATRTWIRQHIPWFLINLGVADKAEDCEKVGAEHCWYKNDDVHSGCYHCYIVREGRLWEEAFISIKPMQRIAAPARFARSRGNR